MAEAGEQGLRPDALGQHIAACHARERGRPVFEATLDSRLRGNDKRRSDETLIRPASLATFSRREKVKAPHPAPQRPLSLGERVGVRAALPPAGATPHPALRPLPEGEGEAPSSGASRHPRVFARGQALLPAGDGARRAGSGVIARSRRASNDARLSTGYGDVAIQSCALHPWIASLTLAMTTEGEG